MTGRIAMVVLSVYFLYSLGTTVETVFAQVSQVLR